MQNFGEKWAWAYPQTAQIFGVPPIISGTGKATNFRFGRYVHRVHRTKSPLTILEKNEAWAYPETAQIFRLCAIISGTRKATNFKFGRVHRNKSPLKIWEERECERIQGLPKFLEYPLLSQERVKLRTSNFVRMFLVYRSEQTPVTNFGKSSRELVRSGLSKFSGAPIYWAHCAVVFAIAQLSCLFSSSSYNNIQLNQMGFFDVWIEQWLRKYLSRSIHNLFINLCLFLWANKVCRYFWSLDVWRKFKIRECIGPYCEHEVQGFLFNVYKRVFIIVKFLRFFDVFYFNLNVFKHICLYSVHLNCFTWLVVCEHERHYTHIVSFEMFRFVILREWKWEGMGMSFRE